jgi:hypothetical protein
MIGQINALLVHLTQGGPLSKYWRERLPAPISVSGVSREESEGLPEQLLPSSLRVRRQSLPIARFVVERLTVLLQFR